MLPATSHRALGALATTLMTTPARRRYVRRSLLTGSRGERAHSIPRIDRRATNCPTLTYLARSSAARLPQGLDLRPGQRWSCARRRNASASVLNWPAGNCAS
jgi:hypothetical protein